MSELKAAVEELGDSIDAWKKTGDKRIDALQERIEIMEAEANRPRGGLGDSAGLTKLDSEYKSEFINWVRKPLDKTFSSRLSDCQHELARERKDVTIGTAAAGGYALPEEISRQIEHRERQLNPFRGLVREERCGSNDFKALVSLGDGTSGWSSETGTRSATGSPALRERAPTFGEQYAYPTASEWALDDIFFDVQKWLVDDVSADFAAAEATAIISGNGSSRPTGVLNTTPVTTSDTSSPMRAAAAIQYVGLQTASSPVVLNMDSLINLVYTVAEKYLMEKDGVAFVMHRLTASLIRRLKASTAGSYLWQESSALGQPATLLGYPVYTCDAMPTVANDNFAVLFGNWRRGYLLVDRVGMRITLNPFSVPGQVSFYVRRRVGGCVLNNDAIKALRISD